jgi:hypothetical protein
MRSKSISPKKSRIHLLQEFEAAPDNALFRQETPCALLDCSSATLERDRCVGGGIPYLKIGRSVRYRKNDILAYLAGSKSKSSTSELEPMKGGKAYAE